MIFRFAAAWACCVWAASTGTVSGQQAALAYQQGRYEEAAAHFRPAAERGDPIAQFNLGMMYAKGQGVPQDDDRAADWLRKAAGHGDAKAQNELGVLLYEGRAEARSPGEALEWFQKAAAQGDADGRHNYEAARRKAGSGEDAPAEPLAKRYGLPLVIAALATGAVLILAHSTPQPKRTAGAPGPAALEPPRAPAPGPLALPDPPRDSPPSGRGLLGGKYRLGARIGEGGMGLVFEGRDVKLDRRVAIKRMRPELGNRLEDRARFLEEARIVAQLSHPFIVPIHDVLERGDELYLVFDFVDGKPLSSLLDSRGRLPVEECARILEPVCQAVDAAHRSRILHRDLKPSNIMLDAGGYAKVMDFGVARQAKDSISRATHGDASGTPAYMAPEQHLGHAHRSSDVYSLGVCLYEMLTGELPFTGPDFLAQKERMKYPPPTFLAAGLPAEIDGLIGELFVADPAKRIAQPMRLVDRLKSL